ncbi:hypothetical protein OG453_36420 [Streptomyces sp. NBC_01381]|uniref:hypothetical protein n=1 Tax=Streptomyces sp. NBC_01381 TaxID=2903845 RepID=UPI00225309C6|nr:hypothetical protein [Streptomyces sp. NBC_01381]MCX4672099.1 hypothetical protein [Streptomyces sp. NBC_01381]
MVRMSECSSRPEASPSKTPERQRILPPSTAQNLELAGTWYTSDVARKHKGHTTLYGFDTFSRCEVSDMPDWFFNLPAEILEKPDPGLVLPEVTWDPRLIGHGKVAVARPQRILEVSATPCEFAESVVDLPGVELHTRKGKARAETILAPVAGREPPGVDAEKFLDRGGVKLDVVCPRLRASDGLRVTPFQGVLEATAAFITTWGSPESGPLKVLESGASRRRGAFAKLVTCLAKVGVCMINPMAIVIGAGVMVSRVVAKDDPDSDGSKVRDAASSVFLTALNAAL